MLTALVSSPTKQERASPKLTRDQGFASQELRDWYATSANRPKRLGDFDIPAPRTVRSRT